MTSIQLGELCRFMPYASKLVPNSKAQGISIVTPTIVSQIGRQNPDVFSNQKMLGADAVGTVIGFDLQV